MKVSPNFNVKLNHAQPQAKETRSTNPIISENRAKTVDSSKCTVSFGMAMVNIQNQQRVLKNLKKALLDGNANRSFFSEISEDSVDELIKKLDIKNIGEHLENLQLLDKKGLLSHLGDYARRGHFSSKKGAKYLKKAALHFDAGNGETMAGERRSDLDLVLAFLDVKKLETADKRGLFQTAASDFDRFKDLASLTQNEWIRLKENGFDKKLLNYASENEYVNEFFLKLDKRLKNDSMLRCTEGLKNLEKILTKTTKGDNKEISRITRALDCVKDISIIDEYKLACFSEINTDMKLYFRNIERIKSILENNIKGYDTKKYNSCFDAIMFAINKHNLKLVDKLVQIEGIKPSKIADSLEYASTRTRAQFVENMINKIQAKQEPLAALPNAKYARLNPRILKQKEYKYPTFNHNTDLNEVLSKTKQGEVAAIGSETFVNDHGKMKKLGLDFQTFDSLFPPYHSNILRQSDSSADCYLLSGGIISFLKHPKAKVKLFEMFSKDGNDIIVTIPAFKDIPIRFPNGEVEYGTKQAVTKAKGITMLEQAYAKARYIKENKSTIDSELLDSDKAIDYIARGHNSIVVDDFLGTNDTKVFVEKSYRHYDQQAKNSTFVSQKEMEKLLDKYAKEEDTIFSAATGCVEIKNPDDYSIMSKHSYAIEKIDSKNKMVHIINPYNTMYVIKVPYKEFVECFNCLYAKNII